MKRIDITYGGVHYSIANQDLDEVQARIVDGIGTAGPVWLRVNQGQGSYQETDLLIAPGISIAVTGIDAE